jgi:hypothetical protein
MKLAFALTIAALLALVSVEATYAAAARGERQACSIACSGRTGGGCGAYTVSQHRCFNKCLGYDACPVVGFPTTKKTK